MTLDLDSDDHAKFTQRTLALHSQCCVRPPACATTVLIDGNVKVAPKSCTGIIDYCSPVADYVRAPDPIFVPIRCEEAAVLGQTTCAQHTRGPFFTPTGRRGGPVGCGVQKDKLQKTGEPFWWGKAVFRSAAAE